MNAIFPFVPLYGMSTLTFFGLSTLLGVFFGFFLERAGFGSAINLSSIFILRDFRVFRVMFSAVVTAMLGLQVLRFLGLVDIALMEFDATFFWSMLVGGLVFGVGFYVGGYCPGTALVALVRGRWDGAAFLFGIILGIYVFALIFDVIGQAPWFTSFYAPADAARQTLYGNGPAWPWVFGLTAVALIAFKFVPVVERRFALHTVEQLEAARAGKPVPPNEPPQITGWMLKAGPVLAGVAALAVAGLELVRPFPSLMDEPTPPAAVAVDEPSVPTIDPLTLASWLVAEAHRRAHNEPPNAFLVDLRPAAARAKRSLPGAQGLELTASDAEGRLAQTLAALGEVLAPAHRLKPVVFLDDDGGDETSQLVAQLRERHVNAMLSEGGFQGWERAVLTSAARWPTFTLISPAPTPPATASPAGQPLPDINLAELQQRTRRWLAGDTEELPPRLALPGTILLPAKAATVRARGGGGGGCG